MPLASIIHADEPATEGRKREFIDEFVVAVNAHKWTDGRSKHRHLCFIWRFGATSFWFKVVGGRIAEFVFDPGIALSWDFGISAPDNVWEEFLRPFPKSPYHHLFGLWARIPSFSLDGNREVLAQNAAFVNELLRIGRSIWNGRSTPQISAVLNQRTEALTREQIGGSYHRMRIGGENCRVYVEEAGQGADLLLLHTAGSDSRQFYHLLNDERLTKRWKLTAFDLPGHGKSLPSAQWFGREYRLSASGYVEAVLAFVEQAGLKEPVVLGCSMAGAICLRLAQEHPEKFAGVVACEAAERVPGRLHDWLRHPRVDSAEFGPQWIDGLMSPYSPESYRNEILWEYSQAGAGVFFGDVAFYSGEFALTNPETIDTKQCPVYMLTGEYDYSCTPEMSRETAQKIPGAKFQEMKKLGHFPMSENPDAFMDYFLPILDELLESSGRGGMDVDAQP